MGMTVDNYNEIFDEAYQAGWEDLALDLINMIEDQEVSSLQDVVRFLRGKILRGE